MNYTDSLKYLNSFQNFERLTLTRDSVRWNLDRMRFLLKSFGNPQKDLFSVHIVGTKGKGSTGFFLESILRAAGYRTGFYSSPHLESPRERIRLQGAMIPETEWARGLAEIKRRFPKKIPAALGRPTYFEIMTLLAVLIFRKKKVDAAIFEAGLGGRLDATNALGAQTILLTPIHMDHEEVLGNTLQKIAYEKAAVIRKKTLVLTGPQMPAAMREIQRKAREAGTPVIRVRKPLRFEPALEGQHQRLNAALAAAAAGRMFSITEKDIKKGLSFRNWPGRMEHFKGAFHYVLDGAHNPASIEALVKHLEERYPSQPRVLVFAVSRDKKSGPMLRRLGKYFKTVVLCRPSSSRSQEPAFLALQACLPDRQARPFFENLMLAGNVPEALELARMAAGRKSMIVITGSFYLIGEARKEIRKHA
jgi:dihydrofolate synthase/folylpolyglutamate synthase